MKFLVDDNIQDAFDNDFEETLRELNQAVIASGALLEGNLFYHHHTSDHSVPRPHPGRVRKRRNFCLAIRDKRQLLEIGFNAGHSALMACAFNPELHYTGVDICSHPYSEPCAAIMKRRFKDRFSFHKGDSREVLPRLALELKRYDIFHIDGSHRPQAVVADTVNCFRLADSSTGAHIVFDDMQLASLSETFEMFRSRGYLVVDALGGEWQEDNHILGRMTDLAQLLAPA